MGWPANCKMCRWPQASIAAAILTALDLCKPEFYWNSCKRNCGEQQRHCIDSQRHSWTTQAGVLWATGNCQQMGRPGR